MRKRPTGRSDDRPVPSTASTGDNRRSSAFCALAPNATPAAPSPSMPSTTRRPIGAPSLTFTIAKATDPASLADGQLGPVDPFGRELVDHTVGDGRKGAAGLAVGIGHGDRTADVAALSERGHERPLAQQRPPQLLGQHVPPAAA